MVRITFDLREQCVPNLQRMVNNVNDEHIKIYGANFQQFKYRNMFSILTDDSKSSITVGYGFNGCNKLDALRGFMEFNPNKTMPELERYVHFILMWSYSHDVTRWDLAIDIPMSRKDLFLVKDKRKYQLVTNSLDDTTEYLGQRNNVGYVKLYNKQIESKLNYPLTRLEVTMDVGDDLENMNRIPVVSMRSVCSDEISVLNDSDKVLLDLLLEKGAAERQQYYKRLGRKMQTKLKPFIFDGIDLGFNLPIIAQLIADIKVKYCDVTYRLNLV